MYDIKSLHKKTTQQEKTGHSTERRQDDTLEENRAGPSLQGRTGEREMEKRQGIQKIPQGRAAQQAHIEAQ